MSTYSFPYPSLDFAYQGVDFAYMPVTQDLADKMYTDGIRIVGRYLFNQRYPNGKGVSRQECEYYINAGLAIYFYYEINTDDALNGYSRGYTNGLACLSECNYIGVPDGTLIFCTCDTGVTDYQANHVVMDYLQGFIDGTNSNGNRHFKCGIYGGLNVVEAVDNNSINGAKCQAGAWGIEEYSPIEVRQWLIASNISALNLGKIRISNININSSGYASWNGYPVDLVSSPDVTNMWYGEQPQPPTPPEPPVPPTPPTPPVYPTSNMPIWFYLRKF